MTLDTTFGNLKKRVADVLYEYTSSSDTVYVDDGDRLIITSKIHDAANSSIARMFESLPVGTERARQRIYRLNSVAYNRGTYANDGDYIEFYSAFPAIGIYFGYFGSGSALFYDSTGKKVGVVNCEGGESLLYMRKILSLKGGENYRVNFSGNLEVVDFSVYESDGKLNTGALCSVDKIGFALPEGCGRIIRAQSSVGEIPTDEIEIIDGFCFIGKEKAGERDFIEIEYKRIPDTISKQTPDSYTFSLSTLEFEALVCLCACEVCREQDAEKYTRLMYKYRDICEGLRNIACEGKSSRNGFYKAVRGKRW